MHNNTPVHLGWLLVFALSNLVWLGLYRQSQVDLSDQASWAERDAKLCQALK